MKEIKINKVCKDSNSDYHSHKSISASGLKEISSSSITDYLNKEFKTSLALELGSAIHTIILEPELFDSEFYVMPNVDLRTKAGKQSKLEHQQLAQGRTLLSQSNYDLLEKILVSFKSNSDAMALLDGKIEYSHYGSINNIDVRCRPDILGKDFVCDIKSCKSVNPVSFRKDCFTYKWFLQAAFYSDFLSIPAENFRFIAVSKEDNPKVKVFGIRKKNIDLGRQQWHEAFERWQFYKETGICPGEYWDEYKDNIQLL